MTAYLVVFGLNPTDRLAAYKFTTRAEARAARLTPTVPVDGFGRHQPGRALEDVREGCGGSAYVIEVEEDVHLNDRLLLDVFNGLTESGVKRFESRAQGVKRLISILPAVAKCGRCNEPHEDQMPKEYKLGEFKSVRPSSALGKVTAYIVANNATAAQIGAATELNADTVISTLKSGRRSHGVDFTVAEDGIITLIVPEGAQLFATVVEKPEGAPREVKLGAFSQVREDSTLGRIARHALAEGATVDGAAAAGEVDRDRVIATLKRARITHGVDHRIGEDGSLSLVVPDGVELFKPAAAPRERSTEPRSPTNAGKRPKPLAEAKPIRAGTIRERIVERMDGTQTVADIAAALGLSGSNAASHVYCLWRDCGLGFMFDSEKRVRILLPDGMTSAIRQAA